MEKNVSIELPWLEIVDVKLFALFIILIFNFSRLKLSASPAFYEAGFILTKFLLCHSEKGKLKLIRISFIFFFYSFDYFLYFL
jgi:hypothetical protein